MHETVGAPPSARRTSRWREPGVALVPAGVILLLAGLAGDLLAATIDPAANRGEPLASFAHPNPSHLVMFLG